MTELRRAGDGSLVCGLEKADATELLATGWRYPERFVAKGRDGSTDIYGVICRPTNFDPARKYPVIEDIYAGPQGAFVPKAFTTRTYAMQVAELGFVVVQIDGMGTGERGKAFHDLCWRNLGDAGFPDRIGWIRAARRRPPGDGPDPGRRHLRHQRRRPGRPCGRSRPTAISTRPPSPTAAATTTAWTRSGGTSCTWAGPWGPGTPSRAT